MSMYGKYPKVLFEGKLVEQNGLNGAPKAWPVTDCSRDKILTSQAPRNEVDINQIMKKVEKGMMVNMISEDPLFEDVSEFGDLAEATMKVLRAKEAFMKLSPDVRSRFNNDPVNLIEFLEDGRNRKEAEELGLVQARVEPAEPSIPAEPVNLK